MKERALVHRGWQVGDVFTHRRWFRGLDRVQCRVVSTKLDSYHGQPVTVIRVEEIGGSRRASYLAEAVPCSFSPAERVDVPTGVL